MCLLLRIAHQLRIKREIDIDKARLRFHLKKARKIIIIDRRELQSAWRRVEETGRRKKKEKKNENKVGSMRGRSFSVLMLNKMKMGWTSITTSLRDITEHERKQIKFLLEN